jgi:hypothetical protein
MLCHLAPAVDNFPEMMFSGHQHFSAEIHWLCMPTFDVLSNMRNKELGGTPFCLAFKQGEPQPINMTTRKQCKDSNNKELVKKGVSSPSELLKDQCHESLKKRFLPVTNS